MSKCVWWWPHRGPIAQQTRGVDSIAGWAAMNPLTFWHKCLNCGTEWEVDWGTFHGVNYL